MESAGGSCREPAPRRHGLAYPPSGRSPAAAGLRRRPGRALCGPSPSCRRHNPLRPFHSGSRLPLFGRFQRLAVEDRGGRAGLAAERFAQRHVELFPNALPDAVALELAEDVVDRGTRRKCAARQIPPGTAGAQKIEDRIHRPAHVGLARPPARLRRRDQRFKALPLRIGQIARQTSPRLFVSLPVRLRPHPESKPPSHPGGGESRPNPNRQKLLGQALRSKDLVAPKSYLVALPVCRSCSRSMASDSWTAT